MVVHEYGDPARPKIILLHPMGLTGDDLYRVAAPFVKGNYCFICPNQGGHGDSGPYVSLEEETEVLREYLLRRDWRDILLLYGASMGTTVAYELMQDSRFQFRHIWLDGGSFAPRGGFVLRMMEFIFKHIAHQARANPEIPPPHLVKQYGTDFARIMTGAFCALRDEDIAAVCDVYGHREPVEFSRTLQRRVHLEWGESDPGYRRSRQMLQQCFPHAELILREGYGHCEYMAHHTRAYIEELEACLTASTEEETKKPITAEL